MLLALAVAVAAPSAEFTCTPTYVWSADGPIWCSEGMHFRLHGILARQTNGRCAVRGACPAMGGEAARDMLVGFLHARHAQVLPSGYVRLSNALPLRCTWRGTISDTGTASCIAVAIPGAAFPTGRDLACHLIFFRAAREWRTQSKGTLRGCARLALISA